mmetsp:Transcript_831/g.1836  ORF Transcript_831/g.1836 Transcript_831/m.1836 type:complete len:81 (-) Transcript_831:1846-2088(-)
MDESANQAMDTKWFIHNIVLALLRRTFIELVCLLVEDETKAFFAEMVRIETEKVLSVKANVGEGVSDEKMLEMMVKKSST